MIIENLTENNFEEFLNNNIKQIFVFENEEFEYQYYFPKLVKITESCKISAKYKKQA